MLARSVTTVLLTVGPLAVALAQPVAVGPEFHVNTYTTGYQYNASVAVAPAGDFMVVWRSGGSTGTDTDRGSIQGQRYDATGVPQGGEFQVNTYTTGYQFDPDVAVDGAGNFVVVWFSVASDGPDYGSSIQARRYDAAGAALGPEFQVNSYTTGSQSRPSVAADGAGKFVVVWESDGSSGLDDNAVNIRAQRYDAAGALSGTEFQVNAYTTSRQERPTVAFDGAGNFIVLWDGQGSAGSDTSFFSVHAQRYDGSGVPQGGEFQVNTYTTDRQSFADVAFDGAGNFVVVWTNFLNPGPLEGTNVHGQRYDSAGTPVGGEFRVNTYTIGFQEAPTVVADASGSFVVFWSTNVSPPPDAFGSIWGRRYDASGTPHAGEFQVNSYTTGGQFSAVASMNPAGNSVVVWRSEGSAESDDDATGIQAQRFAPAPAASELIPGSRLTVKKARVARFVARPAPGDAFPLPTSDPTTEGASLRFVDTGLAAGYRTYPAPATGWRGLGSPAGSRGYRYRAAGSTEPCRVILVRSTAIKAVCSGPGVTLAPPFAGDVGIVLTLGTADRYCAAFGGDDLQNDATQTKRKNAPAPAACP